MTISEIPFRPFCLCSLNTRNIVSKHCQGTVKPHGYFTHTCKVSLLLFCTPSTYCLFTEQDVYYSTIGLVYVFFPCNVYKILNVLVCVYFVFILSFLLFCSVLVYHGYTNDNISPWRVGSPILKGSHIDISRGKTIPHPLNGKWWYMIKNTWIRIHANIGFWGFNIFPSTE